MQSCMARLLHPVARNVALIKSLIDKFLCKDVILKTVKRYAVAVVMVLASWQLATSHGEYSNKTEGGEDKVL